MVLMNAFSTSLCHHGSLKPLTLLPSPVRLRFRILRRPKPSSCLLSPRLFSATTSINGENTADSITYNLYQYKICPFSNIAKVVLKYQKVPFRPVEVNPLTKAELSFSKDYRKVPIVLAVVSNQHQSQQSPTKQFNGTEEILAHFASHRGDDDNDSDFAFGPSSLRWQEFAKSKLAPLLYPNLCRTLSSSFRAFDYVHDADSPFTTAQRYTIQYVGSLAMYFAASKIKKKYNIDDVRTALDNALEELEVGLSSNDSTNSNDKGSTFLRQGQGPTLSSSQQAQPDLGDLTVFGVLKGLEGLPIFDAIMRDSRFPLIQKWYSAMDDLVHKGEVN